MPPPGPRSLEFAEILQAYESPAISTLANGDRPIFWEAARGSNVLDADGNVYIDTTSAFGVASVGHAHPAVVAALEAQSGRLLHGMGDYLPPIARLELAVALRDVLPSGLDQVLFGTSGAEAVELALKCAAIYTGRHGVIGFNGGFHGQTYGVLAVTSRPGFSARFRPQLGNHVELAPFPNPYRRAPDQDEDQDIARCLAGVRGASAALKARGLAPGCVIVEPVQGREGDIVPPAGFLPALRSLCDELGLLLIADEIYTGFGRTGAMWACDQAGVVPDLLCAGKSLGGGLPISIVAGRSEIMAAWRPDSAEAPHASTFLGNPLSCAAALAVLGVLKSEGLIERGRALGEQLLATLRVATADNPYVGDVRGSGMMIGIELVQSRTGRQPYPELMPSVLKRGLEAGLVLLPGGTNGNVISLSPPFVLTEMQAHYVAEELPECIRG